MNCESCNLKKYEITESSEEGRKPYYLCMDCQYRLINRALRPLEFFNLVSIHGNGYYLHDDFYDYEIGEATQPEIEVLEIDKFPFPKLDEVQNDLNRLIDYAFVQYFIDDNVIDKLKAHKREDVLKRLQEKVSYNRSINYKAYEVAAKAIGKSAGKWIKEEWQNRRENELLIFAEAVSNCLEFEEAFDYLTIEIERLNDKFLSNNRILNWIEKMAPRIVNVTLRWGHLAASSKFNWEKAVKWLNTKRPLSLISLDAIQYCTTKGKRLNQSLWMRKLDPKLIGSPNLDVIKKTLSEYLEIDNVPRTRNTINQIIKNISDI